MRERERAGKKHVSVRDLFLSEVNEMVERREEVINVTSVD
jgi:hypothetical protein